MTDTDFFTRLYSGFEAEHFVTGKFFGAGLEAFKLPADFGFDLLVSNQKETSMGTAVPVKRTSPFPYAVQVKSRRITDVHFVEGPNGRPEAIINFKISSSEFELLSAEARSYLACVAFPPAKEISIADQVLYFWLSGFQLALLHKHMYLREVTDNGKRQYELQVGFRFLPAQSRQSVLERLQKEGKLTADGAKDLEGILPAELRTGWGTEYVALYRCPWSRSEGGYHGERTVAKQLKACHLDLSHVGTEVSFPTDDDCESFPPIG